MKQTVFQNSIPFYPIRQINDFRDLINQSAELFSQRPVFKVKQSDGEFHDVLYSQFRDDVYSLGTALTSIGCKSRKIGIMAANSYQWCTSYLAITCTGNVVVPVDKELPIDDVINIINVSEMDILFTDKKCSEMFAKCDDRLPETLNIYVFDENGEDLSERFHSYSKLFGFGKALYSAGDSSVNDIVIDSDGLGVLLFTSGTTGMSKGVCLSQKNICSDLMNLSGVVKIRPDDQLLSVLPLHHTYECSLGFLMIVYSGACTAFCEGLRYIAKNMQEIKPTIFVTVPLMIEKMYAKIIKSVNKKKHGAAMFKAGKFAVRSLHKVGINLENKVFAEIINTFGGRLRLIITGAAAIDPQVARDFMTFGIKMYIGYGLTECSPLVIGNHDRLMTNDSVGNPLPNVQVKIDNPDETGVGEILVKGPMVMLGYYNDEKATCEVLDADGWFHTGDLGVCGENNTCKITGRSKNVIVTKNGKNIFPEEVEFYLNRYAVVGESMVFGKDVAADDTVVSAKIFPNIEEIRKMYKGKDTITKEEINLVLSDVIREVNKHLPKYKNIMNFDIRESEFIKTTTQKIKRQENVRN